ncbi:lamin tail-like protein [Paucimonas lemoignei]|uniref:Lamin tail-like protein n=1 Tax=Paucimonas lemoignei TaxID=29443 RepID=A0A4R3I3Z6_PAULE|nr:lamin tail domain-containing protein [Paucimonas lemoignei]TCS39435.1 lamin tail-like protein [Paucimonas lemoignei]
MPLFQHLRKPARTGRAVATLSISVIIAGCGGGGGQDGGTAAGSSALYQPQPVGSDSSINSSDSLQPPNTLTANDPAASAVPSSGAAKLLISEVATNYYSNDVAWFEIYNPGGTAVSLANYTLRSSYLDTGRNTVSLTPMTFGLPALIVAAGGHVVVAGRVYDNLQNNQQIVYVSNGNATPYWNANGSLELVYGGRTADFVRFGTSGAAPLTAAEWTGVNVTGLPSGPGEYGRSIVRLASSGMVDTNSARDWSLVNFATPAGKNDVAPGAVDSDGDGIPDSAKLYGGTYAGLDLYAMGARPGRRDLFIEIDYMNSADPGITPRREALQKLLDAFAEHNIAVHIDTGNLYSGSYDPAQFNLGGGNAVNYAPCIQLSAASAETSRNCTSFYIYKSQNFDVRRKFIFHYAIFGSSLNPNGSAGSSGVAELYGSDLIVSLGNYGLTTFPGAGLNLLVNLQASTLMHELGHNLGLHHGGDEDTNYKPNHYSVMNYMYQFAGLSDTPNSAFAAERYYLANNMKGKSYCNLVENSPCSSDFRISYSNGSSGDLDERNLVESANIGRGSVPGAYADWDNDGALSGYGMARNINPQMGSSLEVLHDFNEWGNLTFAFSRHFAGANTGDTLNMRARKMRANPMNHHARLKLAENPLPESLQSEIQRHRRGNHSRKSP